MSTATRYTTLLLLVDIAMASRGSEASLVRNARKSFHRLSKSVMKSHRFRIPNYDMPIRLRLWFLAFTCIIMIILAFLGFTNFSRSLPMNDKLLHFLCFGWATAVFYFIIDVEEDARRIWFWRHSGLIFTAFVCFFCGGILSEVVQSLLPYKEFQAGDVMANLLGSSVGLVIAYHLERHYRHRKEIARLYRPIDTSLSDLEYDDEDDTGTQLLPTHFSIAAVAPKGNGHKSTNLADVWDEREEVFDIGEDSDDDTPTPGPAGSGAPQSYNNGAPVPKIMITDS
ncbi:Uncharacterized protein C11E3.10 [Hypsizygus marmoreus]|uniref:Uncharacterized protein C11E3.10 n=1 Tax=Hypsizygus marmoreus TaxID=39966 RepID=A0A369JXM9_HYPMA|nr:Uncharacterized protein C11E3.10 [Hypsizygus marmoreus]